MTKTVERLALLGEWLLTTTLGITVMCVVGATIGWVVGKWAGQ